MPQRTIRSIIGAREGLVAPPQTTVLHATRMMQERGEGTVLVVDGGRLAGIFTERDVLYRVVAGARDPRITLLSQVMTANPQAIHPDETFGHALHMMLEGGFRNVPVVEDGRPLGVVSIRDALSEEIRHFANVEAKFPISAEMLDLDKMPTHSRH